MKYSEEVGEKPEKISSSDDLSNKKQRTSSQEENNEFMKFEIQNIEINEAREITRNNTKIIVSLLPPTRLLLPLPYPLIIMIKLPN
jgi:hypothetical protein